VPLGVPQRVVALESAVPLLVTAVAAIGTGFAASAMFTSSPIGMPLVSPGLAYFVVTCRNRLPRPASSPRRCRC
jgi:hypothetical protein